MDLVPTLIAVRLPVSRESAGISDVVRLVARERKVPVRQLLANSRRRAGVARARQLAMYLAHVVLSHSLTSVGEAFGRDRTTVSHACALIEDMRDDPRFDADVSRLEAELESWGQCDVH